jgi:hypothetical protein
MVAVVAAAVTTAKADNNQQKAAARVAKTALVVAMKAEQRWRWWWRRLKLGGGGGGSSVREHAKKCKRKRWAKLEPVLCLMGRQDTGCDSWKDETGVYSASCEHVAARYQKKIPCGQTTWAKDTKDIQETTPVGQKTYSRGQMICEEQGCK